MIGYGSRRDFIKALLVMPAAMRAALHAGSNPGIGIIHEAFARDALRGARMSANEARRAARLLGGELQMHELVVTPGQTAAAAGWTAANRLTFVALACRPDTVAELLTGLAGSDVVIINALAAADAVQAACAPTLLHVAATVKQQMQALGPDSAMLVTGSLAEREERLRAIAEASGNVAVAEVSADTTYAEAPAGLTVRRCAIWDPALYRFGAEQLNARFELAYDTGMSAAAWAGWFSVKCAWELAARTGTGAAAARLPDSPQHAFDGHKGTALRFRGEARVLEQPLWITETRHESTRVTSQWQEALQLDELCG